LDTHNQKNVDQKVKTRPLSYGWFSLGPQRGIKWVLWKTNVTFQRQEKDNEQWLTKEELHVAPKVLKELVWRIPKWLESIEANNGRGSHG
jgi:hypothetical protein